MVEHGLEKKEGNIKTTATKIKKNEEKKNLVIVLGDLASPLIDFHLKLTFSSNSLSLTLLVATITEEGYCFWEYGVERENHHFWRQR